MFIVLFFIYPSFLLLIHGSPFQSSEPLILKCTNRHVFARRLSRGFVPAPLAEGCLRGRRLCRRRASPGWADPRRASTRPRGAAGARTRTRTGRGVGARAARSARPACVPTAGTATSART
uniref:Putative secreted protein n=1 Tax=Ixodes ricinus TaxID=34613 RepID=A0A6B0UNJ2_IXORI